MSLKIAHIIPGSGGSFYCGNCLRDSKYFDALRKSGHDVIKIPMYLPIFSDEKDITDVPVFYGAVSIYLKQLFPVFRKAPAWIEKLLNSKAVLKLAASQAGSTRAKGLEEMTISMLMGDKGNQHEELERMTEWLKHHFKPDVVHLSNALLSGLAKKLKEELNVPVVCTLQDEDVWVDAMSPENRKKVWALMAGNANYIERYISVSEYYAAFSAEKMNLKPEKISSIYIGVNPNDYEYKNAADKPRSIGYISRMCHENGLDILTDAFILLKKQPGYDDVTLIVTGGYTGDDNSYLKEMRKKLAKNSLLSAVNFHHDFEGEGRKAFFDAASMISVPVRNGEAFGIYIAESMASGIPVVQPALGAFPEVLAKTGGGIIYKDNTPEQLSAALRSLLDNPELLRKLSSDARKGVEQHLSIQHLALQWIRTYKEVVAYVKQPIPPFN